MQLKSALIANRSTASLARDEADPLLAPAHLDGVGVVGVVGDVHQLHGVADRHALSHPLPGILEREGHVGGEDFTAALLVQTLAGQLALARGGLLQIGQMLEQSSPGSHGLQIAH